MGGGSEATKQIGHLKLLSILGLVLKFHFSPEEKFSDLVGESISHNPGKARIAPHPHPRQYH